MNKKDTFWSTPSYCDNLFKKIVWYIGGLSIINPIFWIIIIVYGTIKQLNSNDEIKPFFKRTMYFFGYFYVVYIGFLLWY